MESTSATRWGYKVTARVVASVSVAYYEGEALFDTGYLAGPQAETGLVLTPHPSQRLKVRVGYRLWCTGSRKREIGTSMLPLGLSPASWWRSDWSTSNGDRHRNQLVGNDPERIVDRLVERL